MPGCRAAARGLTSIDAALDAIGFGRYQLGIWMICGLVFCSDGGELSVMAFCFDSLAQDGLLPKDKVLRQHTEGLIGSSIFVGFFVGSLIFGYVADRFGRRLPFLITLALMIMCNGLSAVFVSLPALTVLRVITGVGIGGVAPCAYTLMAEFLPTRSRGRWSVVFQGWFSIGVMLVGLVSYLVPLVTGRWRILFAGSTALPALALLLALCFLPESPRYLLGCADPAKRRRGVAQLLQIAATNGVACDAASPAGQVIRRVADSSGVRPADPELWREAQEAAARGDGDADGQPIKVGAAEGTKVEGERGGGGANDGEGGFTRRALLLS